jgi:hypothetical protein
MTEQFAEIVHYGGYVMSVCAEPLGAQFAQAFTPSRGCSRGYKGTWEIREGRLYLIKLVGTLADGSKADIATFFPDAPDGVFANWYSGPLIKPESSPRKYVPDPICTYDCDLFLNADKGVVSEAYLSRAGGHKDYQAAAQRYGVAMSSRPS